MQSLFFRLVGLRYRHNIIVLYGLHVIKHILLFSVSYFTSFINMVIVKINYFSLSLSLPLPVNNFALLATKQHDLSKHTLEDNLFYIYYIICVSLYLMNILFNNFNNQFRDSLYARCNISTQTG